VNGAAWFDDEIETFNYRRAHETYCNECTHAFISYLYMTRRVFHYCSWTLGNMRSLKDRRRYLWNESHQPNTSNSLHSNRVISHRHTPICSWRWILGMTKSSRWWIGRAWTVVNWWRHLVEYSSNHAVGRVAGHSSSDRRRRTWSRRSVPFRKNRSSTLRTVNNGVQILYKRERCEEVFARLILGRLIPWNVSRVGRDLRNDRTQVMNCLAL